MTVNHSTCRSCGADIWWCETATGKRMPLDADTEQRFVLDGATGVATSTRVYTSHFVTCPNADQHRKQKSKE